MPETRKVLPYATGWTANALSWSTRSSSFQIAVGSYSQSFKNYVDIAEVNDDGDLVCRASWSHCYPPTKIMFAPQSAASDLIITTADFLRLWEVKQRPEGIAPPTDDIDEKPQQQLSETEVILANKQKHINSEVSHSCVFDTAKTNDFCSPVTSCDWNGEDPRIVGCCSIDTTVTIWDIETRKSTTQLIAHDKEVYDIAFGKGTSTFASCGADGSVRIFDLREMDHCTIVYESPQMSPLLRVSWNTLDHTTISTFGVYGTEVVVIDIRYPSLPVTTLKNVHQHPVNAIGWAPHSNTDLCSAGEDGTACIWDLSEPASPKCVMNYDAGQPINYMNWSPQEQQWIAISTGNEAQLLHV